MEFRIETRTLALLTIALTASSLFGEEFQYEVRHRVSRPPHFTKTAEHGWLAITESEVGFQELSKAGTKPKHAREWHWNYRDIEQLKISRTSITVLTYQDNKWKMGADRQYQFDIVSDKTFEDAYEFLKLRLDQRLVGAIAGQAPTAALWQIPVKHLGAFGGDEGTLQVGEGQIVYKSDKQNASRTWRFQDIENVASSGPFQMTITTFERSKTQYGSLKAFNFQLKQRLDENQYDDLWLRLNQSKGLRILTQYREDAGR